MILSSAISLEHEPGLLSSAMYAASAGWYPLRFNPGTPAEELAYVAESKRAQAVVYSILASSQPSGGIAEAISLRPLTPHGAIVMIGGRLEASESQMLASAGLERIADMRALSNRLSALMDSG